MGLGRSSFSRRTRKRPRPEASTTQVARPAIRRPSASKRKACGPPVSLSSTCRLAIGWISSNPGLWRFFSSTAASNLLRSSW